MAAQVFSYNDDAIITPILIKQEDYSQRYHPVAKLTDGEFGTLFKVRDLLEGGIFKVMKTVPTVASYQLDKKDLQVYKINHPNLVSVLDAYIGLDKNNRIMTTLLFEAHEFSLDIYIQYLKNCIVIPDIKTLMRDILHGLATLHLKAIVHGNLGLENIILVGGVAKLTNFGLSRVNKHQLLKYQAPEILLQMPWFYPADMWSVGCIFLEILTGELLSLYSSEHAQLNFIFSLIGLPSEEDWNPSIHISRTSFLQHNKPSLPTTGNAGELLSQLLVFEAINRATAYAALNSTYLA